tara:strand:- start:29366 stop:29929 length:564 start_codon:yes stop_codon:yes gene_type:complete
MLNTLITSKTRINLLLKFFLNPGTKAYLRELSAEFGESTNAVRVELNRLTEAKLLKSYSLGRKIIYRANSNHNLFRDIQNVVRKFVGLDQLVEDLVKRLGSIEKAYVIGDYAKGIDSGLIDVVLVGNVDTDTLEKFVIKTGNLINRKIRPLVLNKVEFKRLKVRLDIENSLPIWNKSKEKVKPHLIY